MGRFGDADEIVRKMLEARKAMDRPKLPHRFASYTQHCIVCGRSREEIINLNLQSCEGLPKDAEQTVRR